MVRSDAENPGVNMVGLPSPHDQCVCGCSLPKFTPGSLPLVTSAHTVRMGSAREEVIIYMIILMLARVPSLIIFVMGGGSRKLVKNEERRSKRKIGGSVRAAHLAQNYVIYI